MKKLGIILDSFSTLTDEEANQFDYGMLKLNYELDGILHEDIIKVHNKETRNAFEDAKIIRTSLPNLTKIEETIKDKAQKYDEVLVLPIPSNLSGTFNAASQVAKNYKNVTVFDHNFSCGAIIAIAKEAQRLYESGMALAEILKKVKKLSDQTFTLVGLESLDYIAKGGRLQKIPPAVLKLIKIKPILEFKEKNSFKGFKFTSSNMVTKMFSIIEKQIGGWNNVDLYDFHIMHYFDGEIYSEAIKQAENNKITYASNLWGSLTVMAHTGPTSVGICITPKIN
ncbi:hypothetical protein CJJ23_03500 [Mycoplasmopsis agassizii]|uniref:DegV family protein n=1 Tax=Mycoplasmopsis agassizii TaxID=33922 RepID=A0A269TI83_9BACT|nr:DegV family protein [Mycoplasmopsis agassizii]PAK21179.1 hypothetical protein CJJ23_03500 [Mycoplasmopsis agassizii]